MKKWQAGFVMDDGYVNVRIIIVYCEKIKKERVDEIRMMCGINWKKIDREK